MVLEEKLLVEPRIYQIPCIAKVKKTLEEKDEALFVMAMGLGKTVTSAFIVEEWLNSGKRGLFLCHETYILEHVEQEYRKVIEKDIVYKTFYGSEDEGKKDWTADSADMLFASFQSLNNWHGQWFQVFDRNHFDFIVVDESHHGQAPSYKEVIDYFDCKKIGMTATPDRMDLKDIREIFGEEVYTITLEEGIANGWLANVEYHILSDGINNGKLKKICHDVLEEGKRVSIKQINETIFIHERDKAESLIIEEYTKIKEYSGDRKTLLFCERTTHADNLIPHFERSGVMHSRKTWKENDRVFRDFESGDLQYVASVNKFNEGKHVPGVEVIVFLRATDSLTIFWQQLGRALAKIGGKQKVIVLDFVSNIERLIMIRDMMLRIKQIQEGLVPTSPEKPQLDTQPFHVSGEGFDFIFSDELVDVMKIIEALRKGYYETWQEASKAAIALEIKSSKEYKRLYKKDLRLCFAPEVIYGADFPGYRVFLGFREDYNPTTEEIIAYLKAQGINDYWDLVYKFGSTRFKQLDFSGFGSEVYFCRYLDIPLSEAPGEGGGSRQYLTYETLNKVAERFGWLPTEEDKIKRYKDELASYGIIDYWTLIQFFNKKMKSGSGFNFGVFGKTIAFLSAVIGEKVKLNQRSLSRLAAKLSWLPTEEEKLIRYKEELAKHGIVDYWTLIGQGQALLDYDFGLFGKISGFITEVVGKQALFNAAAIEALAEKLRWLPNDQQKVERYKEELAKHGIESYWDLKFYSPVVFKSLSFSCLKKNQSFIALLTGSEVISKYTLTKAAEKIFQPTLEEKYAKYKEELAKKEIVDYWRCIFGRTIPEFTGVEFGMFGGLNSLLSEVLGLKKPKRSVDLIRKMAERLFPLTEDQKLERYKKELEAHGVVDYLTLIKFGHTRFIAVDFGMFGKGRLFYTFITKKVWKGVSSFPVLAEKLGWVLTDEQKIGLYKEELAKHGITDYFSLVMCFSNKLKNLDFGVFGRGSAFTGLIVGRTIRSINNELQIEVANKLGWMVTEDQKVERYREELRKHGITNRAELDSVRTDVFIRLDFNIFGKAVAFAGVVLGKKLGTERELSRDVLNEIAEKLGLK